MGNGYAPPQKKVNFSLEMACFGEFSAVFFNKNSSGDEIENVYFYAVRPEATRIR